MILKKIRQFILIILALVALFFTLWSAYIVVKRPFRRPVEQSLFEGVTYYREVYSTPRPLIYHIIEIERDAVQFFVTPGDELEGENDYLAQKTTDFLEENQLQLAINGDFFKPFESTTPLHYYPHENDPINIIGFAISDGVTYSTPDYARPTFCVTPETAVIDNLICPPDTLQAVGGGPIFFENGALVESRLERRYYTFPQPRTIIALDETGDTVWFIVVDGRQRFYSEGVGLQEVAPLLTELGADVALNLDGGGSVTLVVEENGRAKILNSPIHTRIPLRERAIGNHIGIFAEK